MRGQGFTWLSQGNFYPATLLLLNLNYVIFYVLLVAVEPGNVYITVTYLSCFLWCLKIALGPSSTLNLKICALGHLGYHPLLFLGIDTCRPNIKRWVGHRGHLSFLFFGLRTFTP